jgi:tetratricopeptide (TPR) repeat protein
MSTLPLRECRGHSKGVLKQTTMTYVKRILFAVATFAVFASPATAKDPKDRMWMALTTVQCGGVSVVIWREVDDPTDYYGTTEYAWDRDDTSGGKFPRVQGFVYNDDTGKAFLNGKQCTGVREELRGIKIGDIKIDDAAQQNSRICFDPGSSHDERELGCSAVIESGHESGRTLSMAFCNRGHVLIEKQEYDRAIADLNQAIAIDPGYACSYNNRGRAFVFKGDYDGALADYNQAVRLDPKFALAYNNRADVWLHKGDLDRTIDDLSTAIRLDSKFVLAYTNRCRAWSAQRNFARAIADCDQAIVLAPSSRTTYLLRGSIFRDMRKYDNAIADYSQVIRLAPNDAEGWRNRGLIWLLKYDDDRGIADYDQAIRLDPNDALSYNNRGQAHLSKGHREQAIADFRKALELQPGQLDAVQGLKRLGLTRFFGSLPLPIDVNLRSNEDYYPAVPGAYDRYDYMPTTSSEMEDRRYMTSPNNPFMKAADKLSRTKGYYMSKERRKAIEEQDKLFHMPAARSPRFERPRRTVVTRPPGLATTHPASARRVIP